MGCCFSTGRALDEIKVEALGVKSPPEKEVETVKEVLSVKEIPTRQPPPVQTKPSWRIEVHEVDWKSRLEGIGKKEEQVPGKTEKGTTKEAECKMEQVKNRTASADVAEEISEAWESRSTTTITEIRDENDEAESGEVKQRIVNRSPARYSRRGPAAPNTQIRRPEWDSRTRNGAVRRPRREREASQTPVIRPVVGAGKSPARRNPSPAKRNGPTRPNSPGSVRPTHLEKRRTELEESLENPLVSMECFIFL